ncbi:MAG: glycosyltransferase family 2 protein [Gammaproteobacteria bacterium]|nr:glycosyltransferase family 2 protein [Gammaproteobacteria bacterium]
MSSRAHIVVVNYNAGQWLTRCLSAALACSDGPVTVVDNNSSDRSIIEARNALGANARLRWIENKQNIGFAAANNQVLESLGEEFAVLLNPDCELNSDTLPTIIDAFDRQPKMGLAGCRVLNEDGSVEPSCKRRFPTPAAAAARMLRLQRWFPADPRFADFDYGDDVLQDEMEVVEAVSGAFMVARREAMLEVGVLDAEYFMHCEDLDWCKRFALAGWQVGFISRASVIHAKGVSSASRPLRVQWALHRGMHRFFNKFDAQNYSWVSRCAIKCGIAASFLVRAIGGLVRP